MMKDIFLFSQLGHALTHHYPIDLIHGFPSTSPYLPRPSAPASLFSLALLLHHFHLIPYISACRSIFYFPHFTPAIPPTIVPQLSISYSSLPITLSIYLLSIFCYPPQILTPLMLSIHLHIERLFFHIIPLFCHSLPASLFPLLQFRVCANSSLFHNLMALKQKNQIPV